MPIELPFGPRYCLCKKVKSTPLFKRFGFININKKNNTKVIQTQSVIMPFNKDRTLSKNRILTLKGSDTRIKEEIKKEVVLPPVERTVKKQVYLTRYSYLPYNIPVLTKLEMTNEQPKIITKAVEPLNEVIKIQNRKNLENESEYSSCSKESMEALPYAVTVESLPNMNVCYPQQLKVEELRGNMRAASIDHPDPYIKKQLESMGINNLIRASMPAECSRPAVLNQVDEDEEPYHASLKSLPLTISDLELITASLDPGYTKSTVPVNSPSLTPCYGNFQNLRIDPSRRCHVYHVWFFGIFGGDKTKKRKIGITERFMNLIFGDDGVEKKKMHNKKCQINMTAKKEDKNLMKSRKPSNEISVLKHPPSKSSPFYTQIICNECVKASEAHQKHQNIEDISTKYLTNEELLDILTQKVLNESGKNKRKKSKEPKSVTSIMSMKNKKKMKTKSRIPQPVLKHRYSEITNDTDHRPSKKQKKTTSTPKISTEKDKVTSKTDNYIDEKVFSLESLKVLASKNGPGYLSVLHPVCGCPEVSIFVPCYCSEKERPACCNQALSTRTLNKLRSSSGKHVVLPRTCRIDRPELEICKH